MSKLIPKKIKIGNTRRLYTHTVNGSKRYAATWGRFVGRWGTRFAGPVGVGLITYDFSTFLYNNRVPIQQGMEDRQNLIDDGLIPPR